MTNNQLAKWAIVHSLGVAVYTFLVALLMQNGDRIFGKMDSVFGAALILMLLVLSAAVVGTLIVGKPLMLYLDGKKKEAVTLLGYTIAALFVIFIIEIIKLAVFHAFFS